MNKRIFFVFSVLLLVVASSCDNDDSTDFPEPLTRKLSGNEASIAASSNNFTFDLMAEVEEEFPNENLFISSFSISTAISMVMNGATGTSQEGFIETMGLAGMPPETINESYKTLAAYIYGLDPSVTLNIANSNWYSDDYTINNEFKNILSEYYDAEIFESDFGSSQTLDALNGWVENETNGKIKNILEQISPNDVMFLINAIYFKANWTTKFDSNSTRDFPFLLPNNESVDVPTMVTTAKHWLSYDEKLNAQLIEIPYGNENYAFTIIMPNEASEIDNLVASINADDLNSALTNLQEVERELYLPKFQLDFKADLRSALVNMGMPLSGLDNLFDEVLPLAISKVIHQSFLEVNEEGSEAAAATVIGIEVTSLPAATRVNQPFIFLIRERNSGTILFSGKLLDPS